MSHHSAEKTIRNLLEKMDLQGIENAADGWMRSLHDHHDTKKSSIMQHFNPLHVDFIMFVYG